MRYYTGIALDSDTKKPILEAEVLAYHSPVFAFYDGGVIVAKTRSRRDGTFRLAVEQSKGRVTYILASIPVKHQMLHSHERRVLGMYV